MKMWMNVMRDMEYLLADYDRILDAWGEGGVTGNDVCYSTYIYVALFTAFAALIRASAQRA
jgi:hypothetical protein